MTISEQLKEKREKLGRAWEEYKTFRDGLDKDESKWTDEHRTKFDKLDADCDKLESEIEALEKREEREKKDADRENRFGKSGDGFKPDGLDDLNSGDAKEEQRNAVFDRFLRTGMRGLNAEEIRAFQADSDIEGGYLVTPQAFINTLLKNMDRDMPLRGLCTKHSLKKAASLGVVKLDTDAEDWDWTVELATGNEEDTVRFGRRAMYPHPLAKRVKVSRTLVRLAPNARDIIIDRMKYKLGYTQEYAYCLGSGSQQPLGLFVASDDGLSTSADVSTGNTTTGIKADGLMEAQDSLNEGYQANAKWMFHPDGIKKIRKLKDGDGQYIWRPGLEKGAPNSLLGKSYVKSRFVPNTWTTGLYVGIYGDFSYYWIVDCLDMQMQVLNELYAENNQIGYIGRYEGDGQPVLEEAFKRITLA